MAPAKPNTVTCESSLLKPVAAAFGKRSKAIKYHGRSFSCSRKTERRGGVAFERFNADYEGLSGERIRLSIWEDGELWVNISKRKKKGYVFNHEFRASAWELRPAVVVKRFERTLSAVGAGSTGDLWEELRSLWQK